MQLQPNQYSIKIKGNAVASGDVMPGHLMAMDSGMANGSIRGTESREPAFGLPAWWISPDDKAAAEARNYTVVEASSVLGTHLTEIIKRHADELLTRQETHSLLDTLRERNPKLVDEVVGDLLKPGEIQKVLQGLLRERVPIRDLESILETLGDWAPRTKDTEVLTEYTRNALARSICRQHTDDAGTLLCVTLDPKLEDLINTHMERSERGSFLALQPAVQSRIVEKINEQLTQAQSRHGGQMPVIICSAPIRAWVRRLVEPSLPHVAALSYNEIVSGIDVKSVGMVSLDDGKDV
jgi:flagellar biosynthesis protein FlhA